MRSLAMLVLVPAISLSVPQRGLSADKHGTASRQAKERMAKKACLAGDPAKGVFIHYGVQNGIRYLVAHLVRVALGHRLGREQVVIAVDDAHGSRTARWAESRA